MSLLNNTLSLYIPHVFPNVNEERVKAIFNSLDIGDVSHVDFIKKHGKDGQIYNSLYIHFNIWYNNKGAANFQENVLNPNKEAKLVYDDPWYWVVLENTSSKKFVEQYLFSDIYFQMHIFREHFHYHIFPIFDRLQK